MTSELTFENLVLNTEKASGLLTAMANEKRLQILCELSEKELSVGMLAEKVDLSQSALSQHLAKLRALKLVSTRRDAQTIYYSVASPMIIPVLATLDEIFSRKSGTRIRSESIKK
ncbi:MAG: putative DNA-binding protein [Candidatus Tokpelaia sp. JSC188]|nr:MAG: putative DNA-binding protein [Candidatus Tokpelaia sp. JSC188]